MLIMLSPGGLLLPQGMKPNQQRSVGIYLWQLEHNSHTKIILDVDLTPAQLAQPPSCCQGPLISRSTEKHQDGLQNQGSMCLGFGWGDSSMVTVHWSALISVENNFTVCVCFIDLQLTSNSITSFHFFQFSDQLLSKNHQKHCRLHLFLFEIMNPTLLVTVTFKKSTTKFSSIPFLVDCSMTIFQI